MTEFQSWHGATHPIVKLADDWNSLLDHGLVKAASYIIRKNGTLTEAINGDTGKIFSTGADAATVIQAAINALSIVDGWRVGNIYIKSGIYIIKQKIIPSSNLADITIVGDGYYATRLYWDVVMPSNFIFDYYSAVNGANIHLTLRNIGLFGGTSGNEVGKAVRVGRGVNGALSSVTIENILVNYCVDPAISLESAQLATFFNPIMNSNTGFDIALTMPGGVTVIPNLDIYGGSIEKISSDYAELKIFGTGLRHVDIKKATDGLVLINGAYFDPIPTGYGSSIKLGSDNDPLWPADGAVIENCDMANTVEDYFIDVICAENTRIINNRFMRTSNPSAPATYINVRANAIDTIIDQGEDFPRDRVVDAGIMTRVFRRREPDPGYKNWTNLITNGDMEIGDPPSKWLPYGVGITVSRSTTQAKINTYSAKVIRSGIDCGIYQDIPNIARYDGKKLTIGCWVYATVLNRVFLWIGSDGVGNTSYSSPHSGVAGWEWHTITLNVGTNPTWIQCRGIVANGDTTGYFDGIIVVEGDVVPTFAPRPLMDIDSNSGTATIVNGQDHVHVIHGLNYTPLAGYISVHPIEPLGAATYWYVDTPGATEFIIHVDADPTQDVDFAWNVIKTP